ncbi:MAG: T9SS type A sorting domain-containing protein, partial [Crocinitomicaceae bacterium]
TAAMVTLLNQNQTVGPWKIDPSINDGYPAFADGTASIVSLTQSTIQVSVYPSPFTDYINVESENMLTSYSLIDISGKIIQQGSLSGNKSKIDTQSIGFGMYILLINSDKGTLTHKIIK